MGRRWDDRRNSVGGHERNFTESAAETHLNKSPGLNNYESPGGFPATLIPAVFCTAHNVNQ